MQDPQNDMESAETPLKGASLSLVSKLVVLPFSAVATFLTMRLVVSSLGVDGFGTYALLVTLPGLLSFADLGIGAAVANAIPVLQSRSPLADRAYREIITSQRILLTVAFFLAITGIGLWASGSWNSLLGTTEQASHVDFAALVASLGFATSIALGVGPRVVYGLGKNHILILLQGAGSLTALFAVFATSLSHPSLALFVAAASIPPIMSAVATHFIMKQSTGIRFLTLLKESLNPFVIGASVKSAAGPMSIVVIALPLAYQTDRIILSYVSGPDAVATYSLVAQLFTPLLALISSTGQSLWPYFAGLRATGSRGSYPALKISSAALITLGFILGSTLAIIGPKTLHIVTRAPITYELRSTSIFFGILLLSHAMFCPVGMYLTDASGLRFQAITVSTMMILNVTLSTLLSFRWGTNGPIIGSAISIFLAMTVPAWLHVHRRERKATVTATLCKARSEKLGDTSIKRSATSYRSSNRAASSTQEPITQYRQ